MRKLGMFNQVTLDGYFAGVNGDISWAHKDSKDAEWNAFVAENVGGGGVLVFGRITYEMMAGYDGIEKRLTLRLSRSRPFANGSVLLCYEPMA